MTTSGPSDPWRTQRLTRLGTVALYARVAFAAAVLVFGPAIPLMVADETLPMYEHTGWLWRLFLAIPATVACALVLWPPVWLVCRRSAALPMAAIFAVIYTPVFAFQLVGYLDVRLDHDPGRRVLVRYVRFDRRSKGPSYDVLTSWRSPDDTVSLSRTWLHSDDRVPGAPVTVTVHAGALGSEWVDEVRAARASLSP